jgi:hypothetical protein
MKRGCSSSSPPPKRKSHSNTEGNQRKTQNLHVILGKDYLQAIDGPALSNQISIDYVDGLIGMKLHRFSHLLSQSN